MDYEINWDYETMLENLLENIEEYEEHTIQEVARSAERVDYYTSMPGFELLTLEGEIYGHDEISSKELKKINKKLQEMLKTIK